jgi:hypothetical protein
MYVTNYRLGGSDVFDVVAFKIQFSRLLKKSLRLRNPGDKRDFLRVDGTGF